MPSYQSLALAALLLGGGSGTSMWACHAFVGSSGKSATLSTTTSTTPSTTSLNAMPPLIISPIIKKWRENNAKANMPLASDEERGTEAPGLRVGKGAWKWPPVWPYDREMFMRTEEIVQKQQKNALQGMMGGGGLPELPANADAAGGEAAAAKLDLKEYWSGKAGVTTGIDEEAAAKLTR